jgi:hypothetical protein
MQKPSRIIPCLAVILALLIMTRAMYASTPPANTPTPVIATPATHLTAAQRAAAIPATIVGTPLANGVAGSGQATVSAEASEKLAFPKTIRLSVFVKEPLTEVFGPVRFTLPHKDPSKAIRNVSLVKDITRIPLANDDYDLKVEPLPAGTKIPLGEGVLNAFPLKEDADEFEITMDANSGSRYENVYTAILNVSCGAFTRMHGDRPLMAVRIVLENLTLEEKHRLGFRAGVLKCRLEFAN